MKHSAGQCSVSGVCVCVCVLLQSEKLRLIGYKNIIRRQFHFVQIYCEDLSFEWQNKVISS